MGVKEGQVISQYFSGHLIYADSIEPFEELFEPLKFLNREHIGMLSLHIAVTLKVNISG